MGDGGIDLHGLQGFFPLLFGGLILHGAHVVQPVTDLDEDDPDVLGHGHEHLAQILHLLLFLGDILHPGQLGDPLHQRGHGLAELFGDVLVAGGGVLDAVVEQGRDDAVHVQPQVGHDLGHGQGVDDIGLAAFAQLAVVGRVGKGEGVVQPPGVQVGGVHGHLVLQGLISFQNRVHTLSSRCAGKTEMPV